MTPQTHVRWFGRDENDPNRLLIIEDEHSRVFLDTALREELYAAISPPITKSEQEIRKDEREKVIREKFIEIGNKLAPYFDENYPLYVGSPTSPAGQALRTVMEALRKQGGEQE